MGMLQKIAMENKTGRQIGVFSVCTSNQLVIRAALRHAGKRGYPLVLEATSNQCNQFGGYTGMTPKDYMDMVHHLVEEEGCPASQLILGGDHLGPLVSCHKPEREAMKDAADMIRAYAAAGFGKIHIDTSMRLGDDDPRQPLAPEVCARRAAELALVVRETCRALPDAEQPVLVVGSEVPIPGGSLVHEDSVTPTSPVEIARQIRLRNLSGVILVDFVDMDCEPHRQQVMQMMREALAADRVKTVVHGFTSLGLMEITRKRTSLPLRVIATVPCTHCGGTGRTERKNADA